jgi:N-acetylglucosamine malate deacetylase 2
MQSTSAEALKILAGDPVKTVAIFAPHPDDEVIGASSLLMMLREQAFVLYITDGAPNLVREGYDRVRYAELRRQEAEEILRFCDIPKQHAIWLNLPDQGASYNLHRWTAEIRRVISEVKPNVIVTPSYEGGHPDHDSTALATAVACAKQGSPRRLEMLCYHSRGRHLECDRFLPPPRNVPECRIRLTLRQRYIKAALFNIYASQREILRNSPTNEERFRVAPEYKFLEPPHAGKLYYELFSWGIDGSHWRERARMFLQNSVELFR